jgi:Lon-like protease
MYQPPTYLPSPPPPVRGRGPLRRGLTTILVMVLAVVLCVAAVVVPLPFFYVYLPGPVRDVERLVEVPGEDTYSSEGELYLTTVSVDTSPTVLELLQAAGDSTKAVVVAQEVTGGRSLNELERMQKAEMKVSKRRAEEVALTELGFGHPEGDGARVLSTVEGSPARGVLQRGDVITSVNGEEVKTTCDVGRAVDETPIGEEVTLGVRRDGESRTLELATERNPLDEQGAFIGIAMEDIHYRFETGVDVEFKTGRIAGPSAGLMFTLALYDQLTPDDLTRGRSIAGTGTIDCGGGVGPIGGVEQKVAGAEARGAEIFLSPTANAENARSAAHDIRVVSISTFEQAVEYLEDLPN